MTRNHFSKHPSSPCFVSNTHTQKEIDMEIKIEVFVYRVLRMILSIPRRFLAGAKRAVYKTLRS